MVEAPEDEQEVGGKGFYSLGMLRVVVGWVRRSAQSSAGYASSTLTPARTFRQKRICIPDLGLFAY